MMHCYVYTQHGEINFPSICQFECILEPKFTIHNQIWIEGYHFCLLWLLFDILYALHALHTHTHTHTMVVICCIDQITDTIFNRTLQWWMWVLMSTRFIGKIEPKSTSKIETVEWTISIWNGKISNHLFDAIKYAFGVSVHWRTQNWCGLCL